MSVPNSVVTPNTATICGIEAEKFNQRYPDMADTVRELFDACPRLANEIGATLFLHLLCARLSRRNTPGRRPIFDTDKIDPIIDELLHRGLILQTDGGPNKTQTFFISKLFAKAETTANPGEKLMFRLCVARLCLASERF